MSQDAPAAGDVATDRRPRTDDPSDDVRSDVPGDGRDGDGPPGGGRGRSPLARVAIAVTIAAMVGMWAYVLFLAFGPGRQPPLDRLDDPAFAEAGEPTCADALAEVEALPGAGEAATSADRADVIDDANAVYGDMLDDLEAQLVLAPAGDQRGRAEAWLADWRVYLQDRADFAVALRTDPEARMLVSEKAGEGRQVTGWIDEFANANRMPSCATPTDV